MSGLTGNNAITGAGYKTNQPSYEIDQSLRFNDGDGTYLSKAAPGAAGNLNNWTVSVWLKRGQTTGLLSGSWEYQFFGQGDASPNPVSSMSFSDYSSDAKKLVVSLYGTSDSNLVCKWSSDPLYQDHSAWYHVVVKWDNTQSAAADILKVYVNGEVVSGTFGTSPSNGTTTVVNKDFKQFLGKYVYNTQPNWWDGYMAEYHFIDGQSLTAASFGETNSDTNQWVPIEYGGTHGTQGWYLNFSNSSSLGADSSSNGNNFTANVLAATDQVLDSPTNNFATINPLIKDYTASWTLSEGNLKFSATNDSFKRSSFMLPSSGKWYCEVRIDNNAIPYMGVASLEPLLGSYNIVKGTFFYNNSGLNSSYVGYDGGNLVGYSNASNGDIVGIAHDSSTGETKYYLNNSLLRTVTTAYTSDDFTFYFGHGSSGGSSGMTVNFGQDSSFAGAATAQGNGDVGEDFYYTPPTGYKALNTNNLSDPSIADPTAHFVPSIYSGNGSSQTINTVFAPDLAWVKRRDASGYHIWTDTVRGAGNYIVSNVSDAESTGGSQLINAFTSSGFTVGTEAAVNNSSGTYVGWSWKAGGTAASNGDGSITSSVSANTTAGFSIVSYTGNSTAGATVGHGLSQAPELVIAKERTNADSWLVFSEPLGNTKALFLNENSASGTHTTYWNNTSPSSTVVTLGSDNKANGSGTIIMYCFHSVDGYSKVGRYTGNASTDGPFVYTGFRPAWIMLKNCTTGGGGYNWVINDSKRVGYNADNPRLRANLSGIEDDTGRLDIFSNGFKLTQTYAEANQSGATFIYLAFAESPFKYSNAR